MHVKLRSTNEQNCDSATAATTSVWLATGSAVEIISMQMLARANEIKVSRLSESYFCGELALEAATSVIRVTMAQNSDERE